ncbi:hypothetical protein I4U23_023409 [Adineta vaga]|nr:hypothetical protein I4U23_023409 [Adineta vaga]
MNKIILRKKSSISTSSSNNQWFHNTDNDDDDDDDDTANDGKRKYVLIQCCSSIPVFVRGLLIGSLVGGLMLIMITPFWITSAKKSADTLEMLDVTSTTIIVPSTTSTLSTSNSLVTTPAATAGASSASSSNSPSSTSSANVISTTLTTTSITTTVTTTSTSTKLATTPSCGTPSSPVLTFNVQPSTYKLNTYDYVATYDGVGILEFGFTADSYKDYWYIDDISLQDLNESNSEMLTNGDFENGDLSGWESSCTDKCRRGPSIGSITTTSCYKGTYCYRDSCGKGYNFLRQSFQTKTNHVYTLSFWILCVNQNM